jgi:nucleoside-diphosphate-sugar epimerase
MKIAIFGASGRTGRPLVEQALAQGHEVTALVRDVSKLPVKHPRLTIVPGDATDLKVVEQVIAGQSGVISVLGPTKGSSPDLLTTAMTNIIAAMKKQDVRRLIVLTGAGVPDPLDQPKFIDILIRVLFKLPVGGMQQVLQDSIGQVDRIKASDLDWIIVRGPRLTQDPPKGQYRVGYLGKDSGLKVGRSDLAEFMLKQLTGNEYLHKLPVVSY